jgi:hypothetical protein
MSLMKLEGRDLEGNEDKTSLRKIGFDFLSPFWLQLTIINHQSCVIFRLFPSFSSLCFALLVLGFLVMHCKGVSWRFQASNLLGMGWYGIGDGIGIGIRDD